MPTSRTILLALGALAAACSGAAVAADIGVSVQVSQPGVYGRIDIGRFPQPAVIVAQPVIIARPVAVVPPQPAYLWVPPGHRKNWAKHCHKYDACGVPVYFVRHDWYDAHVRYSADGRDRGDRRDHGDHGQHGKQKDKDHPGHGRGKG